MVAARGVLGLLAVLLLASCSAAPRPGPAGGDGSPSLPPVGSPTSPAGLPGSPPEVEPGLARAGGPAGAMPPAGAVRLVTWNVHNLFDAVDDPYDDEVPTSEEVDRKLRALGRVLVPLAPDLLALQEVENAEVLGALAAGPLAPLGFRWQVLEEGNDTARGIDVAFLSRVDLAGYRSHAAEALPAVPGAPPGYRFSRDCLEVHVRTSEPFVVLVNHFKSQARGGGSDDAKRRAQSLGVARIMESLGPSTPAAVVGDLNDRPDSWSLAPLLRDGLHDVLGALPEAKRATYRHRGRPVALDYILVNEALAPRVVPGSARVVDTPDVRAASDHRPVVVDLRTR